MDAGLVASAIGVLAAPDTKRPGQEFDGRRIKAVDGGWLILNGEKYRKKMQEEMIKARNRRSQDAFRRRQKLAALSQPITGEGPALRAERNGASQEEIDQIVTEHLPAGTVTEPSSNETAGAIAANGHVAASIQPEYSEDDADIGGT